MCGLRGFDAEPSGETVSCLLAQVENNGSRIVIDALNGLAWLDDRQVTVLNAVIQRDAIEPGMRIVIRECGA